MGNGHGTRTRDVDIHNSQSDGCLAEFDCASIVVAQSSSGRTPCHPDAIPHPARTPRTRQMLDVYRIRFSKVDLT